ncbi:MAG: SDR family NAD(P)-dependent oxidoreductase [Armatimonadota bacterium]
MPRVALVTGADRGLGLALTKALLEAGWIVIAGRHLAWPELDELCENFSGSLHLVELDVSSDESVSKAAGQALERVSQINLLISNAAIHKSHHVEGISEDLDFDSMLQEVNVNAIGALRIANAFLPLLEKSELKRMCFVSSEAGSIGASQRTGWFGYCMSKAALNMAVKNLSNDLSAQGYSFRLYHPGWMRTYMSGQKNLEAHMEPEEAAAIALNYFLDDAVYKELKLHCWDGEALPW